MGTEGLKSRYLHSLEVAQYCKNELIKLRIDAWTNKGAITVIFPQVPDTIKEKWQLATEDVTHIICMPNVSKKQIDEFIRDVAQEKETND